MTVPCEYCGKGFESKTEVELHIGHDHPEVLKEKGVSGFFSALQVRYSSKKRMSNR